MINGNGVNNVEIESELLGECSVEAIKRGFIEGEACCTCVLCGERFEKGKIYMFTDKFYEGSKAVTVHIQQEHQSVGTFLLNLRANNMGISELQLQLLNFFAKGLTDKEIADYLGVSGSTIRNHRYKLRERERQNKLFLALMETLESDGLGGGRASLQGERLREIELGEVSPINEREKKRILERYMTDSGRLKSYPQFEKNRRIVLEAILKNFCIGKCYSEEELQNILSGIYRDYKLLKDELMAYDYIDRTNKGAIYWIKNYEVI